MGVGGCGQEELMFNDSNVLKSDFMTAANLNKTLF